MLFSNGLGGAETAIQAIGPPDRHRLESLPAHIAVLDASGTVNLINPTWKAFAVANGGRDDAYLGENYLDVCCKSASTDDDASASFEGIKAVLDGDLPQFAMEYPLPIRLLPTPTTYGVTLFAGSCFAQRTGSIIST
jgi:hypothetical protein